MKRNTALFGASLVAGVAAASGLIMTSTSSSAAPSDTFYGVAWGDATSGETSGGWTTGTYADPYGVEFSGSATAGTGTFHLTSNGGATVTVTTTCVAGKPSVAVVGGGAAGVHTGGSVSLAKFTGAANAQGTVTFATQKVGGHTAGAYINFAPGLAGTWVALTGADCTTSSSSTTNPPTSSSTTNPPTSSSTTAPPSSSTTAPPSSSTTAPPTSTTTPPSSSTTAPPTTPPATTEPPTPTPTTTTLPVTG
ncbi:hypothetical protein GCM10011492_21350 [Flexivirga endophytica]|uniref:Uncharacterized protein n=1 Tax=Flexivirga endophytica TaxID=1849103 RepID=A0A916T3Z6_9MICO|nr:hypothetical protein [Flexivirga endophytica]GGB30608.1 hypothetical protein GCM10011492_21350 [Flexivirga endophytica]GHB51510.1 hypothetical protein GCM10008112_20620 [Flexivirga endophytica]